MSNLRTLYRLEEGERARVVSILSKDTMKRRFFDLGLVPDTEVECAFKNPAGDSIAYYVRGAVIAFRMEDAVDVLVSTETSY